MAVGEIFSSSIGLAGPRRALGAAGGQGLDVGTQQGKEAAAGIYNVKRFGARGDGETLDSPAINKAIEAAASAGGGTVRFPAGTYLCFSIRLKSHVALYLERGATILGATPPPGGGPGYDPPEPGPGNHYEDYGHRHWHNALIWGVGIEDVSILGPGLIYGKGLVRTMGHNPIPGLGDKAVSLKNCHGVTLRDFSILQGGHFGVLATGVDNFTVDNVLFDTNRDGIDIDCCRNVRVSNCTINSPWDDGLCPKSSYALGYARATENVTITNCFVTGGYQLGSVLDGTWKPFAPDYSVMYHGHLHGVPRNGRFKCGTESNGGFKNIAVSNCVFEHSRGIALETVDGALLEDIAISNITMRYLSDMPIFMRLGSRMRGPAGMAIGKLRRVSVNNLVATHSPTRYAAVLSGIPGHAIEDVRLSHVYILHEGGGTAEQAAIEPPEKENGYPEPNMFGTIPAYGFFLRHVRGISMSDVQIETEKPDARPAFVLEDVEGADFVHIKTRPTPPVKHFALKNVKDFNVYLSRPLADTHIASAETGSL